MNETDIDANVALRMRGRLGILLGGSRLGFLPWHIPQDTVADGRRDSRHCSSPDMDFADGRRLEVPSSLCCRGKHWLWFFQPLRRFSTCFFGVSFAIGSST